MINFVQRIDMGVTGATGLILIQSPGILITTGMVGVITQIPLELVLHIDQPDGSRRTTELNSRISRSQRVLMGDPIYAVNVVRQTPFAGISIDIYTFDRGDEFELY